jgi:hypothetical protein
MTRPGRDRRRGPGRGRRARSPGRRLRWALLLLTGLTALFYVVGSHAEAGASPAGPAGTSAAAEVGAAAQPRECKWEVTRTPDDKRHIELRCDGKIVLHPSTIPEPPRPPLPSGCRWEYGQTEAGPYEVLICEDSVPVTDDSKEWVDCRDEHDFWFDDIKKVEIPRNAPQWWKDEIRIETEADEGRGCQIAEHVPNPMCREVDLEKYSPPGLLPDKCWGTYPSANYSLSWNDGGPFDFENKMQGWTGSFMYTIGKGAIVVVLWMVGWAFSFDITKYTVFADNLSDSYDASIVGPFELKNLVWFVLFAWCGFAALRGKVGTAGGEIAITFVAVGIMTVLLGNQSAYMNDIAKLMDETSARLLVAGQAERCLPVDSVPAQYKNNPRADCRDGEVLVESNPRYAASMVHEIRPLQQHIHEAFVEQPYAYMNWGRVVTDKCLDAQNRIVGIGYDEDGWPERHMRRAGCDSEANFNRDVTGERMLTAFLTMLVALVVAFFLGLMAITVVISKFLVALLFAVLPFAAVGAVLPGTGRRLAWMWFGTLLQLVAAVVLMSFLLSLLLLGVDEVLRTTADVSLIERWFIVLLTVGAVYFGRKRLLASSKSLGENLADSMTRLSPGGRGWTGSSKGLDLTGIDRGAKNTLWSAGAGAAVVGRTIGSRLRERRVARRGYRNLERMERTRERPRLEYRLDGYRFHPSSSTPAPLSTARPALPAGGGQGGGGRPPGGGPGGGGPGGGGGGRPSHIPPSFTQTPGGAWTGPAADWDAHSSAPAPAPVPAAAPAGGGGSAGGGGGGTPAPMARERIEVLHHRRAPRPFIRHPVGHMTDRVRAGFPVFGTTAQAQRQAERAFDQINRGTPRRRGLGWR